jgi:hypothetical protein
MASSNVAAFFHEAVIETVQRQRVDVTAAAAMYLANLLVSFVRTAALFETTPEGVMLRPLALIYADAVNAPTRVAREQALRRLGDVALFIAGAFSASLRDKAVDVDYYIAMGGNAYDCLAQSSNAGAAARARAEIYAELATKFVLFVDVVGEVCDQGRPASDLDLLRLYEVWLRTGSARAAAKLRGSGIVPIATSGYGASH